jgi:ribosomal protein S18 acetylase RimI-like enzyme
MPTTILPLNKSHIPEVARVHSLALAGDFLPSLGELFLRVFYRTVIDNNLGFGFVAIEDEPRGELAKYSSGVRGFILGSYNTSDLFRKVIRRSAFQLGFSAIPAVLRHPKLIFKALETFSYPGREGVVEEKTELLVIAIDQNHRGAGLGKKLVNALNQAFLDSRGNESKGEGNLPRVSSYKLTVLESNQNANAFYLALGFKKAGQFRLYGQNWNVYIFRL